LLPGIGQERKTGRQVEAGGEKEYRLWTTTSDADGLLDRCSLSLARCTTLEARCAAREVFAGKMRGIGGAAGAGASTQTKKSNESNTRENRYRKLNKLSDKLTLQTKS